MRRRFRIQPRFYLLLAAVLALIFGMNCGFIALRIHKAEARIHALWKKCAEQEAYLAELDKAIAYAQTDACVENTARHELNLLYPGEIRYIAG